MPQDDSKAVFDYIVAEEAAYRTTRVPISDGWEWNMYEHIKKSTLYKNSKFTEGPDDGSRPFKNILRPILNVAYRSEGFDVKDIEPFVNDPQHYYKSFLTRKYHAKWARENDIDTFIDETVETYVDYGLALTKNVGGKRPENVPPQMIAFCDQTDILSGPICLRHEYSIDQLLEQSGKWYPDEVKSAIDQAQSKKNVTAASKQEVKTPGKYIEVYELHGTFKATWLNKTNPYPADSEEFRSYVPEYAGQDSKYFDQIHIVTFYKGEDGTKKGICLYKGREYEKIFKALVRDKIFGRACGFGGIEELFEDQVWINYSEIKIKDMLDAAALVVLQTADKAAAERSGTKALQTGAILYHDENKPFSQLSITPQNIEKFNAAVAQWEQHARTTGSANDALLGAEPASGTPFKLQELVTQEGKGIHDYRRGKVAIYIGEIYRDWVLKALVADMNQGQKFIDDLSVEELQEVSDAVATNYANKKVKAAMLSGKDAHVMSQEEIDQLRDMVKEQFMKGGSKRFLEILQSELESLPIDVNVNIAGKQKYLARNADKLTNIFRQIIAAPGILQQPGMAKLFNEIIENSGFSPINFAGFTKQPAPVPAQPVAPAKVATEQPVLA